MEPKKLLTADEVAAMLGYCREYVYKLARDRKIPCVRLGVRTLRFDPDRIRDHIQAHSVS